MMRTVALTILRWAPRMSCSMGSRALMMPAVTVGGQEKQHGQQGISNCTHSIKQLSAIGAATITTFSHKIRVELLSCCQNQLERCQGEHATAAGCASLKGALPLQHAPASPSTKHPALLATRAPSRDSRPSMKGMLYCAGDCWPALASVPAGKAHRSSEGSRQVALAVHQTASEHYVCS